RVSGQVTLSRDGQAVAAVTGPGRGQVLVFDPANPGPLRLLKDPFLVGPSFSPDGKWLVTGNHQGSEIKIWDARTGKLVQSLPAGRSGSAAFSPGGRWLATGTAEEHRVWEVGSWRLQYAIRRENPGRLAGRLAFSSDGSVLALSHAPHAVRLVAPASG